MSLCSQGNYYKQFATSHFVSLMLLLVECQLCLLNCRIESKGGGGLLAEVWMVI